MVKIKRINSIHNLGVYKNYTCQGNISDFNDKNIIYGWNYSGKTTISRLFNWLNIGSVIDPDYDEATFEIELHDGTKISQETRKTTGSSIGRALVGGVIAGPAGAVIGGATAKKNAETKIQNKTVSSTKHNYTVRIHIADIVNPLLEIQCSENEEATHKIVSTIFAIIEQNKQSSH